jgi:hypothetical protein
VGRIECGGGEGGEPALSPLGWKPYASRLLLCTGTEHAFRDVSVVSQADESGTGTSYAMSTSGRSDDRGAGSFKMAAEPRVIRSKM